MSGWNLFLAFRKGGIGGIEDAWEIWWGSDRPTTSHGPCQGHQTDVPRDLCSKKRAGAGVLVGKFIWKTRLLIGTMVVFKKHLSSHKLYQTRDGHVNYLSRKVEAGTINPRALWSLVAEGTEGCTKFIQRPKGDQIVVALLLLLHGFWEQRWD